MPHCTQRILSSFEFTYMCLLDTTAGSMNRDYAFVYTGVNTPTDNYTASNISTTILGARLSYIFNLLGPCFVVDTACSSGLMAVHQACQAVRSGQSLGC